ncbi:type II toxin-antitoxin system PemK/MazF family toxin [Bacillus cereus]|uniref:type II toxin-antitoxin system PemK/MazF family toxin n=1 Tax=Bacillus cereus TaxID=1396 RepID=UPI000B4B97B8|nr:type II toxin-antitoxin system PemK/MazF family toxin [Bacillus cereus]
MNYVKGQIIWVDFDLDRNCVGSEQKGERPAVVVQNDFGNRASTTTLIVPLTSNFKTEIPTHVNISSKELGKNRVDSIALCEQVRVISKERIIQVERTILSKEVMKEIDDALLISFGVGTPRIPQVVWVELNGMGNEQKGNRPAIVIQNDVGNKYSTTLIVAPLQLKKKKRLPTHVEIPGNLISPTFKDSIALLEQVRVVDKERVTGVVQNTDLTEEFYKNIEEALLVSFGI